MAAWLSRRSCRCQRARAGANEGLDGANVVRHDIEMFLALHEIGEMGGQRRMNAGLSRAVAGKTVGSVEQKVHYDENDLPKSIPLAE